MKVSIGAKIIEGPFGGGNAFINNLANYLKKNNFEIINHLNDKDIDIILLINPLLGSTTSTFDDLDVLKYINFVNLDNCILIWYTILEIIYMRYKSKKIILLMMLTLVSVMIFACTTEEAPDKPLVIYSGRGESLVQPLIDQFSDMSGIEVEVNYGKTTAMASTLLEEGDKTPADVFFAQDPGGLGSVDAMLTTLSNDVTSLVPEWARDPQNKWVGTSGRARVVVYNTDAVSPSDLPASLEGFTDPKWKGKIGFPPTNSSFHAMVTGMRLTWGDEKTKSWLEGIMANEPKFYAKNTPTVEAAGKGEIEVGFVNHYYLHRFIAENGETFGARNYHTTADDPGSIVLVAGAGVLEQSDNKDNAEKFLKFLLSPVGQQFFASQTYEYPLNDGAKPNRMLTPLSDIKKFDIDIAELKDIEGTVALLTEVGALQ